MLIILLVAMLTWVVSFLIIRAISRYREFCRIQRVCTNDRKACQIGQRFDED